MREERSYGAGGGDRQPECNITVKGTTSQQKLVANMLAQSMAMAGAQELGSDRPESSPLKAAGMV